MSTRNRIVAAALLVVVAVAAGAVALVWRDRGGTAIEAGHQHEAGELYYCPMHPTVTSPKPGNCPICGMALVKRTTPSAASDLAGSGAVDPSLASISLSPEQRVTANARTMQVVKMTGTGDIVTTGRVTFDERRLAQVTSYTAGRIERLYVNFTGDTVRRGAAVAAIYSPELFSAQQEYLLALSNRERMRNAGFTDARSASNDLVESSQRRLALLGMTSSQVAQLARSGKPLYTTTIISPVSGIVTNRAVVPQQYVNAGQPLLEVADLSMVWVEADVYESQLPEISVGGRVAITSPAVPGRVMEGSVSFIQPVIAGQSRTATVRIDLPNPGLQLKPDMYVSVRIFGVPAPEHIMVPKTAVVDRGQRQFVWVEASPGTFEPRQVQIGPRHGEQVVIAAGLTGGENIVVQGAFLLDSEAQLRGATAGSAAAAGHQGH
jgi:membrane fusion protein, copper/silver efflux system